MRVVALIPAAGRGRRMGADRPKAFLLLRGLPLLVHTLQKFEDCPTVNEILPLVPDEEVSFCRELVFRTGLKKVPKVLSGGPERQDSVYAGLKGIAGDADVVMIHDGARPFVPGQLIEKVLAATERWPAVAAALPVGDTLKEVSADGQVLRTLDRSRFWVMQTPQSFRYDLITRAHEQARTEGFCGTDDASLVERLGIRVMVIPGSRFNIKITTPEDLVLGEALLEHRE